MTKATVIAISIHADNENPIFGVGVTHLRINDEAGGGFFEITQPGSTPDAIRLNAEELYLLAEEGKKMIDAYDKNNPDSKL